MIIPLHENPLSFWIQGHVHLLEIYNSTCKFIFITLESATQELALFCPFSPVFSLALKKSHSQSSKNKTKGAHLLLETNKHSNINKIFQTF